MAFSQPRLAFPNGHPELVSRPISPRARSRRSEPQAYRRIAPVGVAPELHAPQPVAQWALKQVQGDEDGSDSELSPPPSREHTPSPPRHPELVSGPIAPPARNDRFRSEEHTSELQSRENLVCRLLLEKKKEK